MDGGGYVVLWGCFPPKALGTLLGYMDIIGSVKGFKMKIWLALPKKDNTTQNNSTLDTLENLERFLY